MQLFVLKLSIFISFEHTAIRNDNVSGMPILIIRINSSSLSLYLSFSTVRLRNAFSCFFLLFFFRQIQNKIFGRNHSKTTVWNEDLWCQKITSFYSVFFFSFFSQNKSVRQMSRYWQHLAAIWTDNVLAFHPFKIKHLDNRTMGFTQWYNTWQHNSKSNKTTWNASRKRGKHDIAAQKTSFEFSFKSSLIVWGHSFHSKTKDMSSTQGLFTLFSVFICAKWNVCLWRKYCLPFKVEIDFFKL